MKNVTQNSFFPISCIMLMIGGWVVVLMCMVFLSYQQNHLTRWARSAIHTHSMEMVTYAVIFLLCVLAIITGKMFEKINETMSALAQSEDGYRQWVENRGEMIIRWDKQGKIVCASKAFKEKMNYQDEDITQLYIQDMLSEESKPGYESALNRIKEGIRTIYIEVTIKMKDAKKMYLQGNLILHYTDRAFERADMFLKDLTPAKRLEHQWWAAENKYRALFDLSPLPQFFIDRDTLEFVEVNPAALKKYGYTREEFLKISLHLLRKATNEEKERLEQLIGSFKEMGTSYETSTLHYKKSGQPIEVESRFQAIEHMGRPLFLVIVIDVSKKQKRERQMNKAILKARENERREIGTELHDNICQILASSHMLLEVAKSVEKGESIRLIDKSKAHIMQALTEIRNLSHCMVPGLFEMCSFEKAIQELLLNMNPGNQYAIDFYFDQKIDLHLVSGDIQLNLYRILQEQLRNIVNYARATHIQVRLCLHDGSIRMQIMDDGVGFDQDKVQKGIGLMSMKRRVTSLMGRFSLETFPGRGCALVVELPV